MAKRSYNVRDSQRSELEEDKEESLEAQLEEIDTVLEEEAEPKLVEVTLIQDLNLNHIGKVTGTRYEWRRSGSSQYVDERDLEWVQNKKTGQCCPGGSGPQPYFIIGE